MPRTPVGLATKAERLRGHDPELHARRYSVLANLFKPAVERADAHRRKELPTSTSAPIAVQTRCSTYVVGCV